jgi:heptaprenyl diphosphate synthase
MSRNRKMVFISLLVAQALVLNIIERMIPVPFISPGAKLGLANIITVVAIYLLTFKDVFAIVILRVILGSLVGGNLSGFFYSLSGGILSLFAMYVMYKLGKDKISIIGVSIIGAVFHNIGQILIAALVIQNIKIAAYLPILLVAGVGTGIFVGITAKQLIVYLKRFNFDKGLI